MNDSQCLAGFACCDITPPIGTPLAGGLRPRASEGVRTPLLARALTLAAGDAAVAIVAVDVCVLTADFVAEAAALAQERTGIPAENMMIVASHTHAGPYTVPLLASDEYLEEHYLALLPRYIADAVTLARQSQVPARVGAASGSHAESAHYRRVRLKAGHVRNTWMKLDPDEVIGPVGEIDPELGLLAVQTDGGDPIAMVFNYSLHANCHPSPRNQIDGSYPARVDQVLRDRLNTPALYLPGACGNINPTQSPDAVAEALASEIGRVANQISPSAEVTLWARRANVTLPLRDFSSLRLDAIRRDWPEGEDVFVAEWRALREAGETEVETSIQVLAVNDVAFVANPGEMFVELGREIKRRSPFPHTYVVELANDYVGYIPHRAAYDEGGYELLDARSAKVAPEAGEIIVEESVRLLGEAWAAVKDHNR